MTSTSTTSPTAPRRAGTIAVWCARLVWRTAVLACSVLVLSAVAIMVTTMGTGGTRPRNGW